MNETHEKELAKRLSLTKDTARELYLKSGNYCAFPGCQKVMMTREGNFVGQVCHIEAAEPGGERFNPNMTNEDRRAFANLVLLCYEHHVETNDVARYTVARMKEIKANHEARFDSAVDIIQRAIVDETDANVVLPAKKLARMFATLGYPELGQEEIDMYLEALSRLSEKLRPLPQGARELLVVIAKRSWQLEPNSRRSSLPYGELREVLRGNDRLDDLIRILDRYNVAWVDEYDGTVNLSNIGDMSWNVWNDFCEFAQKTGVTLTTLIVNMDFSVLD